MQREAEDNGHCELPETDPGRDVTGIRGEGGGRLASDRSGYKRGWFVTVAQETGALPLRWLLTSPWNRGRKGRGKQGP